MYKKGHHMGEWEGEGISVWGCGRERAFMLPNGEPIKLY